MKIAIVGAGITGLRCAHLASLKSNVKSITLFHMGELGGVVQSHVEQNYICEGGPQGVLSSHEPWQRLLQDVPRLEVIQAQKQKRFLLKSEKMIPINPISLVLNHILTPRDFAKLTSEFFTTQKTTESETLYIFFEKKFGVNVANNIIIPVATGIWGGGAKKILMKYAFPKLLEMQEKHGSLLKAAFKETRKPSHLQSFAKGMGSLPHELLEVLKSSCKKNGVHLEILNKCVDKIEQKEASFLIEEMVFDKLVCATSPWNINSFRLAVPKDSHSLVVACIGGKGKAPPGFGALASKDSKNLLGILFAHSIFPSHCPPNSYLYRVLLGGDRDPSFHLKSEEEILQIAKEHLLKYKLISSHDQSQVEKVFKWKNVVTLPTESWLATKNQIKNWEQNGFIFAGNYLGGVGLNDCLLSAENAIQKLDV